MVTSPCLLLMVFVASTVLGAANAMAPPGGVGGAKRSCRICTAKTCKRNGSTLLLEAMKALAPSVSDIEIKAERCLNVCAPRGIVIRSTDGRSKTIKVVVDNKQTALVEAKKLIRELK
jgi:hypothetical protein